MSVRVIADVWEHGPDDPTLTGVLLVLANYSDDKGGNCFPGTTLIAQYSRFSERTVKRAIVQLEDDGWITVLQRGSGRPTGTDAEKAQYKSQYQLNVAKLKGCHSVPISKEKGDTGGKKRVTLATEKGDTGDRPPYPLKGVSVINPSVNQEWDTVDTRILCESLGIHDIRQEEAMNRLYKAFTKTSQFSPEKARDHMKSRWELYKAKMPKLEWTFGGAYKFFMSGTWDNPDGWPKKKNIDGDTSAMKFAN